MVTHQSASSSLYLDIKLRLKLSVSFCKDMEALAIKCLFPIENFDLPLSYNNNNNVMSSLIMPEYNPIAVHYMFIKIQTKSLCIWGPLVQWTCLLHEIYPWKQTEVRRFTFQRSKQSIFVKMVKERATSRFQYSKNINPTHSWIQFSVLYLLLHVNIDFNHSLHDATGSSKQLNNQLHTFIPKILWRELLRKF